MAIQMTRLFTQDINKPVEIRQGGDIVFNDDNLSNIVSVALYDGTSEATPVGTVVGAVVCSDGSTVPVTNGTISGNTVSITLTEACFAIPGRIGVGIQLVSGDTHTTVLKAVYNVEIFTTSNVIDPSSRISLAVSDLIDDIATATASIPASYTDLMAAVAPTFSASVAYTAGQYVWYDGELYKFTADHAAGAWTGTDTAAAVVTTDLGDLKSAITEETRNLNYATMGHWGNAADGNIYARGDTIVGMDQFIPVVGGNSYTFSFGGFPSSGMSWTYLFDDASGTNVGRSGYGNLNARTITAPSTATKVHAFCTYTSSLTITEGMYIQIEAGSTATEYIQPISAVDVIAREDITKLFSINGEVLTSSNDLNTLAGLRVFRYNNDSIPTNAPVSEGGRLLNFPSDASNGAGAVQFVITNNTRTFVRYRSSSTWSTWRELATTAYVDNTTSVFTVTEGTNWEG